MSVRSHVVLNSHKFSNFQYPRRCSGSFRGVLKNKCSGNLDKILEKHIWRNSYFSKVVGPLTCSFIKCKDFIYVLSNFVSMFCLGVKIPRVVIFQNIYISALLLQLLIWFIFLSPIFTCIECNNQVSLPWIYSLRCSCNTQSILLMAKTADDRKLPYMRGSQFKPSCVHLIVILTITLSK